MMFILCWTTSVPIHILDSLRDHKIKEREEEEENNDTMTTRAVLRIRASSSIQAIVDQSRNTQSRWHRCCVMAAIDKKKN